MARSYQVVYEPQTALYHIHAENWRQIRRWYYREAVAARWIGIQTTRHVAVCSFLEAAKLILDWGCFLYPSENRGTNPMRFREMARETIRFRANKSIGTIKGLLDGGVMENPNLKKKDAL